MFHFNWARNLHFGSESVRFHRQVGEGPSLAAARTALRRLRRRDGTCPARRAAGGTHGARDLHGERGARGAWGERSERKPELRRGALDLEAWHRSVFRVWCV